MKEFIESLQALVKGLYTAVNSSLEALPPAEQFEANAELSGGLRSIKSSARWMIEEAKRLETGLVDKVTTMAEKVKAEAIEKGVKDGELFRKGDHEAAINAAKSGERQAVEAEITSKFEKQIKAGEARAKLLKDIPASIAAEVADATLLAADAETRVDAFKTRLKKLGEIGITPENSAAFCAEVARLPWDAEGDKAFEAKFAPHKATHDAAKPNGKNPKPAGNPLQVSTAAETAGDVKLTIF